MPRRRTPTFITEIPLQVTPRDELILLARLEAARQLYNAVLGEAVQRVNLIQQSKLYQYAKSLPKLISDKPNQDRSEAFKAAWDLYSFSDYSMQAYAIQIRKSWIGEHIDADTAQRLGTRAFRAARNILLGRSKRVRFKGRNQMDSLEGKSGRSPMKWLDGCFVWKGLKLQPYLTENDPVILHGLNSPVKYVRLVRRKVGNRNLFYAQLINEGFPFQKPKNMVGVAVVGLDIGPSTIAVVGGDTASLQPFCAAIKDKSAEVAKLQRQMSRQQRANNPDCFDPDRCDLPKPGQKWGKRKRGKSIKGKRQTNRSNRYLKVRKRKAEIQRKLAAHRKSLHGKLANKVLSIGKQINTEKLSYRAFQRMFGKSVGNCAPGMFVGQLKRKAENAGGYFNEFPTKTTKLSQRCVCGDIKKKPLSQRVHTCQCGMIAQRDLLSGYLVMHVDVTGCYQAETALNSFQGWDTILMAAWQQADSRYHQSSIGSPPVVNVDAASASERIALEALESLSEIRDVVASRESPKQDRSIQRTPCL